MTDFAMLRRKQCRVLLGHNDTDAALIVLTPLPAVYTQLKTYWPDNTEITDAFYRNTVFQTSGGGRCLLVCVPQGIQAQDILCALHGKRMLFFGFAGSLSVQWETGALLEVSSAADERGNCFPLEQTGQFPTVRCGYSPCLLGGVARQHCRTAASFACQAVDMEIAYCAAVAVENDHRLTAWLLVTDLPGTVDFWALSEVDKARLSQGYQCALNAIITFCEENPTND